MSALDTEKHTDACQVVRENGIDVWFCVGACPAMAAYIAAGEADEQWDRLDRSQVETATDAITAHAIESLETVRRRPK